MREILFRGKRQDNGEWIEGCLLRVYERVCRGVYQPREYAIQSAEEWIAPPLVVAETVGQFTGLTDKNGKRIFEGDICKTYFESYTHSWEEVGVVTEFCGAYGIESAEGKHFRAFINQSVYTRSHEVIGTIYDNPELLEDEQ
jgi:uncharacterized phage protein (TIGR01671 family)